MKLERLKEEVESRIGRKIEKYNFLDEILERIYLGDISPEDLERYKELTEKVSEWAFNYAFGAFQGAVKQYFWNIEKRKMDEKTALNATINYLMGMVESSGILEEEEKREKLLKALDVLEGMCKGMKEMIREMKK